MIFLSNFNKETFLSIYESFKHRLKEKCTTAYPSEYARGFRGATDGADDCIAALNQISAMQIDDIKEFLEDSEVLLIRERRGKHKTEYVDLLDRLIPQTSKIRQNDYNNRLHKLRLFVSFLALNKVVKLNCMVGSHPKSENAATRISSTELRCFIPPLANDFWIGATERRFGKFKQHIQTPIIAENYLDYVECERLSVDKLNQAFKRFADIIVANGITNSDEITFDVLMSYQEDLLKYYDGKPPAYNIKPALDLLMHENPNQDTNFYDEFIKKRVSFRKPISDNPDEVEHLGSTKKAQGFIGRGVCGVDKVIVPSRDRKVVLDYGYWSELAGSDVSFNPEHLEQKNLWVAAQHDYIRHTSREAATVKQKKARLSILNKYLFSYLPAYFKSGFSGRFTYPECPEEFLHSLYIQRSNVFELENVVKFTEGFQYPVPLQQFVYDMTSSVHMENTKNNNSGRDTLLIISNFFDYYVASTNLADPASISLAG